MGIFDTRDLESILACAIIRAAGHQQALAPGQKIRLSTCLPLAREVIAEMAARGYEIEKEDSLL